MTPSRNRRHRNRNKYLGFTTRSQSHQFFFANPTGVNWIYLCRLVSAFTTFRRPASGSLMVGVAWLPTENDVVEECDDEGASVDISDTFLRWGTDFLGTNSGQVHWWICAKLWSVHHTSDLLSKTHLKLPGNTALTMWFAFVALQKGWSWLMMTVPTRTK